MTKHARLRTADANQLFTVTVNLMWQLYYDAADHDLPWLESVLLVAIGELRCGPWRHLGPTPDVVGVRLVVLCTLLDELLAELGRITPGLGARIAVAQACYALDRGGRV
jgi:hypothetical protein